MSRIRLYLDEDSMRRSLVFGLRARGVDVLTALEAGMVGRPDKDQLMAASAAGRTLFTYNTADYCALHQEWVSVGRSHGGLIVAAQQQYTVGDQLRRIMRIVSRCTPGQMQDRLEFLSFWE